MKCEARVAREGSTLFLLLCANDSKMRCSKGNSFFYVKSVNSFAYLMDY